MNSIKHMLNPSPRDQPRRPQGVDLRSFSASAMLMFGILPMLLLLAWIAKDRDSADCFLGLRLGWLATALLITVSYAWGIVFESRNLGETAEFWARVEARVRPRWFYGAFLIATSSIAGGLVSWVLGSGVLAGLSLAVLFTATFFVLLLWGKVP